MAQTRKQMAEAAVRSADAQLRGRAVPGRDIHVRFVDWYGAVDIAPEHCVVWVVVTGADSEQVPAWFFPGDASATQELGPLDTALPEKRPSSLRAWLEELKAAVLDAFTREGWQWQPPRVGFESAERVQREAGGHYWNYWR